MVRAATAWFLCLRQPAMLAKAVVGRTKASIQRWKFELPQNVVPKMGNARSRTGVIKQWILQTTAMMIAIRSSQPERWSKQFAAFLINSFMAYFLGTKKGFVVVEQ
tara:strand:- start:327 stop:644 length:318 start_codon:yes stop_codon:yes gene_type:complete